ncbi:hypothetical protein [Streptomyces sp. G1]|uniref:hypothetical protein n=1 Tax=Streptomyces sp. G1 TaxID=361572 RepID=UPI002030C072|nr:hypothetical protein [Streptomyces sp. G1]MCM1969435.1 hypothetical protein [Streptomyces sp. G1]
MIELDPDGEAFVHGDGRLITPGAVLGPLLPRLEKSVEELLMFAGTGDCRRGRRRFGELEPGRRCGLAAEGSADALFEVCEWAGPGRTATVYSLWNSATALVSSSYVMATWRRWFSP